MGELGQELERLEQLTRRLRAECPWDREQDARSIVPHTVEEAYELADAAARGDDAALHDELGDVLFQVCFLALLLSERDAGDLGTVSEALRAKLIRRHPHVFGESSGEVAARIAAESDASTASRVRSNWERIKREAEGRSGADPFAGVPENLPGPLYARKLLGRAARADAARSTDVSLDGGGAADTAATGAPRATAPAPLTPSVGPVDEHLGALDQALEALAELRASAPAGESGGPTSAARDELERGVGGLLLAGVELARQLGVDPELALRAAADRLRPPHAA